MAGLTVEIVYSNAMYLAAKEVDLLFEVRDELKLIRDVFKENPDLKEILCNPSVVIAYKRKLIDKIFKNNTIDICYNFLNVLLNKRRLYNFEGIVKEFNELVSHNERISKGVIYSVRPLTEDRIKAFEKETENLLKTRVKLENELDATLIGGVSILVEGKLIDASLKSRLRGLSQELLNE